MPKNKTTVLTVNGRNPATGGFIDPRWLFGISSINSIMKVGSAQLTICVNCIDHVSSHKLRILDTKISSFRRRKPPNVEMSEMWRLVAVPKLSGFPHLTWQFTPFHHPNSFTCVFCWSFNSKETNYQKQHHFGMVFSYTVQSYPWMFNQKRWKNGFWLGNISKLCCRKSAICATHRIRYLPCLPSIALLAVRFGFCRWVYSLDMAAYEDTFIYCTVI